MLNRRLGLMLAGGGLTVLLIGANTSFTAANFVPVVKADDVSRVLTPNDKKPDQCASITVTAYLGGSGANIRGSNAAELITGSNGVDDIRGGAGDDCIVGGDGNDTIRGDAGTDVCIGGAGNDTFQQCETQIQ